MVVTGVEIPGHVTVSGLSVGASVLVKLLKTYLDVEGRRITMNAGLTIDENEVATNPTHWTVSLPSGSVGLFFADHRGIARVTKASDSPPVILEPNLEVSQLILPGIGEFVNLNTHSHVKMLQDSSSLPRRVLKLETPSMESISVI